MSKEDEVRTAVKRYVEGRMTADEVVSFGSWITGDSSVPTVIEEELKRRAEDFGLFAGSDLLPITHEMLSAYVDDELDSVDREIVEAAIELDPVMAGEVRELYALRTEISQGTPSSVPATDEVRGGFWQSVVRMLRSGRVVVPLAGLGLAAVVCLFVVNRPQHSQNSPEIVALNGPKPKHPKVEVPTPDIKASPYGSKVTKPKSTEAKTPKTSNTLVASNSALPANFAQLAFPQDVKQLFSADSTGSATLGSESGGKLEYPLATVIRSRRPALRWTSLGADSYIIRLDDTATGMPVFEEQTTQGLSWTPPKDLAPGHTYRWTIQGIEAGTPMETLAGAGDLPARFKVISTSDAEKLTAALKAAGTSKAFKGAAYARFGLFGDAEPLLRAAERSARTPQDRAAIKRLLARVQRRR